MGMKQSHGQPQGTLPRFAGPSLSWNAPVVEALDIIEGLPGFAPDHVEWDFFRFWSDRLHAPNAGRVHLRVPHRPTCWREVPRDW